MSSKGIAGSAWKPFQCHTGEGATGTYWVDPRDAAQDPTVHRTGLYNKVFSVQNVRGAEAETSTLDGLDGFPRSDLHSIL